MRNNSFGSGTICSSRRYDLVTTADLLAGGLSHSAISRRVKRGVLTRRYPGVYSYGRGQLSREARAMAAVLACGEGAALSHLSAAAQFEVSRWREEVPHVVVPRRRRPVEGITVHQCLGLTGREVSMVRGIPVTTVARVLVDLGAMLTPHQLAWVVNEAAFRSRLSLEATRRAMERARGHHGLGVAARAIELYLQGSAGTKSRFEDAFLALDLPEPLVNVECLGYEVDFHWPDRRLAVEIDGNHTRPKDRRGDAARDRTLRAAGYTVVRFTGAQVEQRPEAVLSRLAPLLRATPSPGARAPRRSR